MYFFWSFTKFYYYILSWYKGLRRWLRRWYTNQNAKLFIFKGGYSCHFGSESVKKCTAFESLHTQFSKYLFNYPSEFWSELIQEVCFNKGFGSKPGLNVQQLGKKYMYIILF